MTDRTYLIPVNGSWLALDREGFAAALEAGARAVPTSDSASPSCAPQKLLTAEQMAEATGTPASWFLSQARIDAIPHVKLGKYVRFDLAAVTAKLSVK
jgi:hypothetical protein